MIKELTDLLAAYLGPEQIAEVHQAYLFGARAHQGQQRRSGEPYISHPLAVAKILAELRMDYKSIMAAILHDVIEDTPTAKEQLVKEFGKEVAQLVDGVSKLTQIQFESRLEAQAENFRKMLLAMAHDIRVIIIKLADRLHNMRTLVAMPENKRRRIARETLDIYAPIANRLGMNTLRIELQELGLCALYPMRYRALSEAVRKARGNRKEIITKIRNTITNRMEQEGLNGRVQGREKHLYSLYQKMRTKHLPFSEVFDVYAFRIIVDSVDACYRALGLVHNLYKPVPGKFKDYIAIPKTNGYQTLHTVLFSPYGVPIEVQIRTEDMEKVANMGIAAHWLYKSGDVTGTGAHPHVREWLRGLLEMQQSAGNSLEFLENVKVDLFPDEVYVFTPKGQIMELPRGATAVDFAYAVHTGVGNACVAAKVDRHLVPLSTPLLNGQTVEIITASNARPNPAWLNFVVTGKARANIRHYLKNLRCEESIDLGKRLLDKALTSFSLSVDQLPSARLAELLQDLKLDTPDELYEQIGLGNRIPLLVARRLVEADKAGQGPEQARPGSIKSMFTRVVPNWLKWERTSASRPLYIKGTEGMVVNFAKCCRPIPGDPILGLLSAGRGIVIHTESCRNVAEFRNRAEKSIDVQWEPDIKGDFPVEVRVEAADQRGVLATVAASIAE
ncbi:MAG TPA: RelA/SpoT family protein, partial [Gammaproteobacteria bacterium]|nr:RelA/SpoT family protein [Gammaproteobacteria bacterium]